MYFLASSNSRFSHHEDPLPPATGLSRISFNFSSASAKACSALLRASPAMIAALAAFLAALVDFLSAAWRVILACWRERVGFAFSCCKRFAALFRFTTPREVSFESFSCFASFDWYFFSSLRTFARAALTSSAAALASAAALSEFFFSAIAFSAFSFACMTALRASWSSFWRFSSIPIGVLMYTFQSTLNLETRYSVRDTILLKSISTLRRNSRMSFTESVSSICSRNRWASNSLSSQPFSFFLSSLMKMFVHVQSSSRAFSFL
mmetsp:Transcript_21104/g.33324  ORF Transcript_21104/g.33324 Transcript_21104/m.33324 type:complete len:264 (-) Transcript_21104:160-951(-)